MGHEVDVPMEIPAGVDDLSAAVYDPDGNWKSSTFRKDPDGLFHLRFIPTKAGQHQVRRHDCANKMALTTCQGLAL